jgi:hypothetical protein
LRQQRKGTSTRTTSTSTNQGWEMMGIFSQFHRLVLFTIPREQDIYGRSRYLSYLICMVKASQK